MKKALLLFMLMTISAFSYAQDRKITGEIIDRDTKEAVMQVQVHRQNQ